MISNSGSDERKKYLGGQAGDQTGGEWAIINWYNRPWKVVLRHPDVSVRKEIALVATLAAKNNNIGYDQNQRMTYWTELQKNNYDPSKISTPCEADCSAGVLANCKAVGYRLGIDELKNINQFGYTGNLRSILVKAGFVALTDSKYLTSDNYLLEGDILLYDGKHTATNLTNGSKTSITPKPESETTEEIGKVAEGQKWLNSNYGTLIKNKTGKLLVVDNEYGEHSRWAALTVWKNEVNKKKIFSKRLIMTSKKFGTRCKKAAKKVVLKNGSKGEFVYIAQFILEAKGYYTGKLDADFGSKMKYAVATFQDFRGLKVDGVIGPDTWFKLFNE